MDNVKKTLLAKAKAKKETGQGGIKNIPIELLSDNPFQPRLEMDEEGITDLANSIREQGLMQPITVSKQEDGTYIVVAGHRRVEAHKKLGKKTISAIVEEGEKKEMTGVAKRALIENVQRQDLDPIEIAVAIKNLKSAFGIPYNEIAKSIGKGSDWVSRVVSILKLPDEILAKVREGQGKDIKILSEINTVGKKLEKLDMSKKEIEATQKKLFDIFVQGGREAIRDEIRKIFQSETEKPILIKAEVSVTKNDDGILVNIPMPDLPDKDIKAIGKAIKKAIEKEILKRRSRG